MTTYTQYIEMFTAALELSVTHPTHAAQAVNIIAGAAGGQLSREFWAADGIELTWPQRAESALAAVQVQELIDAAAEAAARITAERIAEAKTTLDPHWNGSCAWDRVYREINEHIARCPEMRALQAAETDASCRLSALRTALRRAYGIGGMGAAAIRSGEAFDRFPFARPAWDALRNRINAIQHVLQPNPHVV